MEQRLLTGVSSIRCENTTTTFSGIEGLDGVDPSHFHKLRSQSNTLLRCGGTGEKHMEKSILVWLINNR